MYFRLLVLAVVGSILVGKTGGAKILALSFFSSRSHKNVYEPLLHKLANNGHDLTVVSPIAASKPNQRIKEIIGMGEDEVMKMMFNSTGVEWNLFDMKIKGEEMNIFSFGPIFQKVCRAYFELPEIKALQNEKFDLVFGSAFMNECTYGLIHKLNTSVIYIAPFSALGFITGVFGTPSPSSFVPMPFFGCGDKMNFFERARNFGRMIFSSLLFNFYYLPGLEQTYREYYGQDTPSAMDIMKNGSLLFMNSHFSINYPRPLLPDIVEVGGMHCRPAQPLPKDLAEYLDGSGNEGFIYFSMGSVVKAHTMPDKYKNMFLSVFSKLKQRVLWKWEEDMEGKLPANIRLGKWLPQQDVLAHPKIRLFITHGGLLSTEEAVYHGVPLVGIPMFGDQVWNMAQSESRGFARTLEFNELTEEYILENIRAILNDNSYSKKVKELSSVFKDRPEKALDKAVFWAEYVLRHKGAVHLRSPSRELNFLQYFSLDVVAFALVLLVILLLVIRATFRLCWNKCCSKQSNVDKKKKRN